MALWEPGDILVTFRHGPGPGAPQESRVGAWYFDEDYVQHFRGIVELVPPLQETDNALQTPNYLNGKLFGKVTAGVGEYWYSDGEQNSAIRLIDNLYGGGGGSDSDDANYLYVGISSGPPNFDYQIAKYNTDLTINEIFTYDPNSPFIPEGAPDANTVKVSPDGSIIYFARTMGNWGQVTDQDDAYIHRIDTASGGLIEPLSFTYDSGNLQEPQDFIDFDIGADGRIYGLYRTVAATGGGYRVFIANPDGLVVADWLLDPSIIIVGPEAIAVNCDATEILVHQNESGNVGDTGSFFELYNLIGDPLGKLFYHPDIESHFQPEGVVFANNRGDCGGPTPEFFPSRVIRVNFIS